MENRKPQRALSAWNGSDVTCNWILRENHYTTRICCIYCNYYHFLRWKACLKFSSLVSLYFYFFAFFFGICWILWILWILGQTKKQLWNKGLDKKFIPLSCENTALNDNFNNSLFKQKFIIKYLVWNMEFVRWPWNFWIDIMFRV